MLQEHQAGCIGWAAGRVRRAMLAAAFWLLLSPAIEMARKMGRVPWLPALIGLSLGALGLYAADRLLLRLVARRYALPYEKAHDAADCLHHAAQHSRRACRRRSVRLASVWPGRRDADGGVHAGAGHRHSEFS
ncbi:MAG: hypothetical protein V8Q82_09220 [Christensenellales bacterium]